jgi:hypothetical protein
MCKFKHNENSSKMLGIDINEDSVINFSFTLQNKFNYRND